jgi:hypothetical protein
MGPVAGQQDEETDGAIWCPSERGSKSCSVSALRAAGSLQPVMATPKLLAMQTTLFCCCRQLVDGSRPHCDSLPGTWYPCYALHHEQARLGGKLDWTAAFLLPYTLDQQHVG